MTRLVLALLLLSAVPCAAQLPGVASPAAAPVLPVPGQKDGAAGAGVPSVGDYLRGVPGDFAAAGSTLASKRTFPWVLAGAAATALAFGADDEVRAWFGDHDPLGGTQRIGNTLGLGDVHAGVALGLFGVGQIAGSRREADAGMAVAEAILVNSLLTTAIKQTTRRARPDDGARNAFPSGHTSSTAALASSLSAMYDWHPGVAVPLGLLTAFVAASRLESDVHWFSDVVAGAALGGTVGSTVGRAWRHGTARGWAVLPFLPEPGAGGLLLVGRF